MKLKTPENPVRIGVVGEYFTAMDPYSNLFLQEKLVRLGASVSRFLNVTKLSFPGKRVGSAAEGQRVRPVQHGGDDDLDAERCA